MFSQLNLPHGNSNIQMMKSTKITRAQQQLRWATVATLCPFRGGELGPRLSQCGQVRGLPMRAKFHLDPSSRLATIDMGQKLGRGLCPFFWGGELSSHRTVAWAEAYLHTKWHLNPSSRLATTDIGRKFGAMPL